MNSSSISRKFGQNAAKTYILSSDIPYSTVPVNITAEKKSNFLSLIPEGWIFKGSELEKICNEMKDNPLVTIACNAENLAQRFADKIHEEAEYLGRDYDPLIIEDLLCHQEYVRDLFYVIIERIIQNENKTKSESDANLCHVYRKESFLTAVFCCVIELLLYSYSSQRVFPWSLEMLDLDPVCLQKTIQPVIQSFPEMSRDMVKHLHRKEEEILEEFGWMSTSPIWKALVQNPDCIPSCEDAWKSSKMVPESITIEEGIEIIPKCTAADLTLIQFIGKVYYIACNRLHEICDRCKIYEAGKRLCWTLFDHLIRYETRLLLDRHLDQNLLCIVYIVAKYLVLNCTFLDIVGNYRQLPYSRSEVYREVKVDIRFDDDLNTLENYHQVFDDLQNKLDFNKSPDDDFLPRLSCYEQVDIIVYYNNIFLPRMERFAKSLESFPDDILSIPKSLNKSMQNNF